MKIKFKKPKAAIFYKFNYSELDASIREEAKQAAQRIRIHLESAKKSFLTVGKELQAMKAKLHHGQFEKWIKIEFGMQPRSARNYISAAKLYDVEPEAAMKLAPTAVYELAARSTPETVKADIIAQVKGGKVPTPKQVKAAIMAAKSQSLVKIKAGQAANVIEFTSAVQAQADSRKQAAEAALTLLEEHLPANIFKMFADLVSQAGTEFAPMLAKKSKAA